MSTIDRKQEEEEVMLPGFRFHPTDEELVGFYLRRKVRNKQLSIELIKQIDIYKYDPWELPTTSAGGKDQELYFFCRRGRKYRNSVRPNRVTGTGFWKATGIDKPIYSFKEPQKCVGLKKSLVYYRGNAGKGTKTDWMMHEFRLPPQLRKSAGQSHSHAKTNNVPLEAEVWTVCRIFKRITSYKKYIPSQPQPQPQPKHNFSSSPTDYSTSKTYSNESDQIKNNSTDNSSSNSEIYLHFADNSTYGSSSIAQQDLFTTQSLLLTGYNNSFQQRSDPAGLWNVSGDLMFVGDDCDELRPVVDPYCVDLDRMYYDCK